MHARGGQRQHYRPVESTLLADGESGDAAALARAYRRSGVTEIYLADLDRIVDAARPLEPGVLEAIGAEWVDAGVRDGARAAALVACGAGRVVVGLETMPAWDVVGEVVAAVGSARTAFSLDMRRGVPLGSVGEHGAGRDPAAFAVRAVELGASAVIVLDLARVGASVGIDWSVVSAVRRAVPHVELVIGGGIRDARDVAEAAGLGCDGVLVGTALHAGTLSGGSIG